MDFQWLELFQSIAIISGIAVFLAILMVIADATIGNYGEKKLTINKDKELIVDGGQPLLNALKSEGIFIPSACGARGSCGLCKIQVDSGGGDFLPTELPWLSDEEQKKNVRLSCQLKVKNDMQLTIPEELFNIKEYNAKISNLTDLTYDIKEVEISLNDPSEIEFKAGQFIQIEVPEYELTDEPVYRAYSVSSQPSLKNKVKLQIKLVPNGICTTYVHKHMKVGENIKFNGPYGDFFLRDTDKNIVMMATGSGMAPMCSILIDMAERADNRKVTFLFGCKQKCDLFLLREMANLEKILPNFKFVPALSRPDEEWEGSTGRLNTLVKEHVENPENTEAYLCAGTKVINSYREALLEAGIPEEQVFYDDFG